MYDQTLNTESQTRISRLLLSKLSNAKKYKIQTKFVESNTKTYSNQISKKLIKKVEASLT